MHPSPSGDLREAKEGFCLVSSGQRALPLQVLGKGGFLRLWDQNRQRWAGLIPDRVISDKSSFTSPQTLLGSFLAKEKEGCNSAPEKLEEFLPPAGIEGGRGGRADDDEVAYAPMSRPSTS